MNLDANFKIMDKKFPLNPEEFQSIYNKVPRLRVDLVIKDEKGIVLSKRLIDPMKGFWHLPGGTVLRKEKLQNAVKRVAKDELGLAVGVEKFLGYIEYLPEPKNRSSFGHSLGMVFETFIISGKPTGSWQAEEVEIFSDMPNELVPEQAEFMRRENIFEFKKIKPQNEINYWGGLSK